MLVYIDEGQQSLYGRVVVLLFVVAISQPPLNDFGAYFFSHQANQPCRPSFTLNLGLSMHSTGPSIIIGTFFHFAEKPGNIKAYMTGRSLNSAYRSFVIMCRQSCRATLRNVVNKRNGEKTSLKPTCSSDWLVYFVP